MLLFRRAVYQKYPLGSISITGRGNVLFNQLRCHIYSSSHEAIQHSCRIHQFLYRRPIIGMASVGGRSCAAQTSPRPPAPVIGPDSASGEEAGEAGRCCSHQNMPPSSRGIYRARIAQLTGPAFTYPRRRV